MHVYRIKCDKAPSHPLQHLPSSLLWKLPLLLVLCISFQSFPHTSNLCVLEARYHGALGIYQVPEYAIIFYVLGGKGACGKRESELLIRFIAITPKAALCPCNLHSSSDRISLQKIQKTL